jgi:energy-coupling factor transporter ATP-binding protein EcfA2
VASFGKGRAKASPPDEGRRTYRSEPGIAMLGATGAGKSTFLGALQIALLQHESNWTIWSRDSASRAKLVELNTALTSQGEFPLPTTGIDTIDWTLGSKRERTEQRGRFGGTRSFEESLQFTLKLTDPSGELARSDHIGLQPREQLIEHVTDSRGILYMYDPIREYTRGDAYDKTFGLLMDLVAAASEDPGFDGRLPHHVAVCVTKFDEPRVFKTAESLRMLVWDEHDPLGFPRVHDSDARDLMLNLCKLSRSGTGEAVPQLLERYFRKERIKYFVTSSVGFMVNQGTQRFDPQDTENVYRIESNEALIRGPVHPINVVEPILWLIEQIALNG